MGFPCPCSLPPRFVVFQHSLESQLIVTSCSHAQLGDSGATELARVLGKNANLRSLILGGNGIGPEGAKALGAALRVNLGLQELHLHNNALGYEGLENLARELAQPVKEGSSVPGNKSLRVLVLRKNGIGPHCGNCALCRDSPEFPAALLELTSLVTIDLNGNDIGLLPLGFVQLPKLVALDVRNNPLRNIPQEVFLTARKGHQSGWPGLKEYMLGLLEEEAAGGPGSPRDGSLAGGGRRGPTEVAPARRSGSIVSLEGGGGARTPLGGARGVPPLRDPRVLDHKRGSIAK
mmetsp:Transcript_36876/g.87150  ORF Transcript_36876/g.87150 Transcript_36876/m.87150 type:complete len:291 (-) Transcript_36876:126-998(-)